MLTEVLSSQSFCQFSFPVWLHLLSGKSHTYICCIPLTNSQHIKVTLTSSESSLSYISLSTVNYEKIKTRTCKHNYISNSMIYGTTKSVLKYHCFQNELMRLKRKIQVIKQFIVYFGFATHGSPMLYKTWSSIIQKSLV